MEVLYCAAFIVALACSVDLVCWGCARACLIQLPSKCLSCLLQRDVTFPDRNMRKKSVFSACPHSAGSDLGDPDNSSSLCQRR